MGIGHKELISNLSIGGFLKLTSQKYANSPAVEYNETSYTYKELDNITDNYAYFLMSQGYGIGDVIGLFLERSEDLLILPLAISKIGAIYVPLETTLPKDRVRFMCEDANVSAIICNLEKNRDTLSKICDVPVILFNNNNWHCINSENINYKINLPSIQASSPFVIFYTSGSTGFPKGVLHSQLSVTACNLYDIDCYNLTSEDKILCYANMGFVLGLHIYLGLFVGACVYIASNEVREDISQLNNYIEEKRITFSSMPTQIGFLFCSKYDNTSLRVLMIAGGVLPKIEKDVPFVLASGYGCTECISASYYYVHGDLKANEIGTPCPHSRFWVMDEEGNEVKKGEDGELWISGSCVSLGYIGACAVQNSNFVKIDGINTFKTGDLVREREDGTFVFVGRKDDMVKINGQRIELGEIDSWLSKYPGIFQSCSCIKKLPNDKSILCSFFISQESASDISIDELKEYLSNHIPQYMIPNRFIQVEKMPLNRNGKIDKDALLIPKDFSSESESCLSEKDKIVVSIVKELLEIKDNISINDNFYALGGDSLAAMELVGLLRKYGLLLYLSQIRDAKNLKELANLCIDCERRNQEEYNLSGFIDVHDTLNNLINYNEIANLNEFNVPELFVSAERVCFDHVNQVLIQMVKTHDMLRAQLKNKQLFLRKIEDSNLFNLVEISKESFIKEDIESEINNFHSSSSIENGSMLQVLIIHTPNQDFILLDCNHLVSDAVSKTILREDFQYLYNAVASGNNTIMLDKTDSYVDYCKALNLYKKNCSTQEKRHWRKVSEYLELNTFYNRRNATTFDYCSTELNEEETKHLRKYVIDPGIDIPAWIITSLGRYICEVNLQKEFCVQIVKHGRSSSLLKDCQNEYSRPLILDRTIGFFPNNIPLLVEKFDCNNIIEDFNNVKKTMSELPNEGIGFGAVSGYKKHYIPMFCVDYLGEVRTNSNNAPKSLLKKAKGISLGNYTNKKINMGASVFMYCSIRHGKLKIQARFDETIYTKYDIDNVLTYMCDILKLKTY